MLRRSEHRIAGHFCASAGGGRNRNEWYRRRGERLSSTNDFKVIKDVSGIREQCGDRFCSVNRAASAKGDYQIATLLLRSEHSGANQFEGGLAGNNEQRMAHAMFAQGFEQRSSPVRVSSSHDQRASAHRSRDGTGLAERPGAKENPSGRSK